MTQSLYCPLCGAALIAPGRCPVLQFTGGAREFRLGLILCCLNCAAVAELEPGTGVLHEFPHWRIHNLREQETAGDWPRDLRSLGLSKLFGNLES